MSRNRVLGIVLSAAGLIIAVVFAIADITRMGSHLGFGPIQIIGTIAGVFVLILGLVMTYRK
jgi:hypothetical protein